MPKMGEQDELDRYIQMAEADIGDDSDILEWWEMQVRRSIPLFVFLSRWLRETPPPPFKNVQTIKQYFQGEVRFPVLSKVAEKILCIPAASARSERVWSILYYSASFF